MKASKSLWPKFFPLCDQPPVLYTPPQASLGVGVVGEMAEALFDLEAPLQRLLLPHAGAACARAKAENEKGDNHSSHM